MLADRMRIKRRNPYVAPLVAVTHWDLLETGAPVQAFRVYDLVTMEEVSGTPTIEQAGMGGAFSPDGTYYAVLTANSTVFIYLVETWTELLEWTLDAEDDSGFVSWSGSGRFVCVGMGDVIAVLDRDDDWALVDYLSIPEPSTSSYAYCGKFIGDRGLVIGGSFDGHITLHEIDTNGTITRLETITSLADGETVYNTREVAAKAPTVGQSLDDIEIALWVQEDASYLTNQLYIRTWGGTTIHRNDDAPSGPVFESMVFNGAGTELLVQAPGTTPTVPSVAGYDADGGYSELGLDPLGTNGVMMLAWCHGRSSIVSANSNSAGFFILREHNGTTLELVGTHSEGEKRGYPTSISVNDVPSSTLLPPATPS